MGLIDETLQFLHKRRENLLTGKINCIPSPFKSFRQDFVGIEQEEYVIVTGNQKTAKSQFTSFMYIYTPILYAYYNPDKIRVKIFYSPLEESETKIITRFMRYLLFYLSKHTLRVSQKELTSTIEGHPISEEILETLNSGEYRKILDFFESHVEFIESKNPTGAYKLLTRYADEHGKRHFEKLKIKNEFGEEQEISKLVRYDANDPDEYVIVITDHVGLLQEERGLDKRQTIKKWSEYCMELKSNYRYIMVNVQQQSIENMDKEAFKLNRIRPTPSGLADCKDTKNDCSLMLGLTNPFSMDVKSYLGYDINKLRDNQRFLEVVLAREGSTNAIKALYFDGAVGYFDELKSPKSPDYEDFIEKVYALIERNNQQTRETMT